MLTLLEIILVSSDFATRLAFGHAQGSGRFSSDRPTTLRPDQTAHTRAHAGGQGKPGGGRHLGSDAHVRR